MGILLFTALLQQHLPPAVPLSEEPHMAGPVPISVPVHQLPLFDLPGGHAVFIYQI